MGIPSYFSYIIKNYSRIIRNYQYASSLPFSFLFMDCNSIIYDAVRTLETTNPELFQQSELLEPKIIELVIKHISEYISFIKPSELVYIAFDGVAPFAKMDQQRIRRHKNQPSSSSKWSTSNITPGTDFMYLLSKKVAKGFRGLENHFHVKEIIVSGSLEPGEGEHKIFQYIREQESSMKNRNATVYGLDSDLIMLSLFHKHYFNELFIFRETPEFGNQFFPDSNDEKCHFLDIGSLGNGILSELNIKDKSYDRIYDYMFICFFLGNDFLPHFPSLNLRTNGMDTLLETYSKLFRNCDGLIIKHKLNWKHINKFIFELSKYEHERIQGEMKVREKWAKRPWPIDNEKNRDFVEQSIPVIYRVAEKYIDPSEKYWQNRYYQCLLSEHSDRKDICINFLEGLEWVYKYYTTSCPHWKWKYNYSYPPLLKDLVTYTPKQSTEFIQSIDPQNIPFSSTTQLCYVLPRSLRSLLPTRHQTLLNDKYSEFFVDRFDYQWAFCRYLWEAHPILPEFPISKLQEIESF